MTKIIALFITAGFLLTACSSQSNTGVQVVVTTNILGNVVSDIVTCAGGTSTTLMPIGASPHDFTVSSRQSAQMAESDLIILNGLELESALEPVIENIVSEGGRVLSVGQFIDPLPIPEKTDDGHAHEEDDHAHEEDDHAHGEFDPHFWLDMARMAKAAKVIGEELLDITKDSKYKSCAETVSTEILNAEKNVQQQLSEIPAENRLLVVDHESFNYFASAYDFEVIGSLIPAISDSAQPTSEDLAELVKIIQARKVRAIFVSTEITEKLADALRGEVGSSVKVVRLYEGSLGKTGSGAETYIEMMQFNAQVIKEALS
jgi:zinc/manganese transport system substrate-binding protein